MLLNLLRPALPPSINIAKKIPPFSHRWNALLLTVSRSATSSPRYPFPTTAGATSPNRRIPSRYRLLEDQKAQAESRVLERFQGHEWKAGDVYSPHDLSPAEMKKWRKRCSPPTDAFDALNLDPLNQYKNFSIMSEYVTPMGRIKHRRETGLRAVNQRKIAKAIRRAVGLGLMPSVHRHPEILAAKAKARLNAGRFA